MTTMNFEPNTLHEQIVNTKGDVLFKSSVPMTATDIFNAAIDAGADLTNAYFERWHFEGVIGPENGEFSIYELTMYKCHIRNCTLQGLTLVRAKINCTNIYNTEIIQCRIPRCGMTLTNLVKVVAHCTTFERLLYSNGKIKNSKFIDCNFYYARFFTEHIDDDVMFSESHLFAAGFQTIPLSLTGPVS